MEFRDPYSYIQKEQHDRGYPQFPWKYARRKTLGHEKFFSLDNPGTHGLEFGYTKEFSAYLKIQSLVDVYNQSNDEVDLHHIACLGGIHQGTWDYLTQSMITKGLLLEEPFLMLEQTIYGDPSYDGPVEHVRLRPTIKGVWAAFLFSKGYKIDFFPDIK
jgi:hypothetical protein